MGIVVVPNGALDEIVGVPIGIVDFLDGIVGVLGGIVGVLGGIVDFLDGIVSVLGGIVGVPTDVLDSYTYHGSQHVFHPD